MIINSGTIREAFQSFNTVFNKAFHEMEAQYPRVAMEVPSETRDENYAWLGAVPSMREWIGDREIKNLAAYGYTIRNKDFEATVTVPRNDLEDDCIGVYKPVFQDLAYSARKHPDKLVFGLFPRSFTEKCFDGKPFISDDHTPAFAGHKAKAQSNKGTYKLVPESYGAARTQMMCLVNDQGEVMNIVPDLLVVAPQKEAIYGDVDWTDRAADYLKNREYRYLSPVIQIQRNTRRAVELHSAALTNTPAIDAMSPIACTDKPNEGEGSAEQENIEDGSKGTLAELAALLQLDPSATIEDVYQAVAALLEGQEALKLKADAYQFEIARTKADGVVLEAMKAGKILPFQRDWAFQSAMDDMDSFNLWLKTAPQVVPMGEVCPENLSQTQRHRSRAHELMGLSTEDITKYGNV